MTNNSPVQKSIDLLRSRGQESLELAKKTILCEKIVYEPLREALCYFIDEGFPDIMHPGLLSLYCESVGGNPEDVAEVGAAIVLLVAAADIHDDIVDESRIKNGKLTIIGKYGRHMGVLAGDAFFIDGIYLLHRAVAHFSSKKGKAILDLMKQAFYDLSSVEAEEASLRGDFNLPGREYLELIKRKTVVSEATGRIGAILGDATTDQVETLGQFGRVIGLLGTLRDEFIDVFEPEELSNRASKEILPLPVLNVFADAEKKAQIAHLLKGRKISNRKTERIVGIVMQAKETEKLREEMRSIVEDGLVIISKLEKERDSLKLLLKAAIQDIT